MRYLTAIYAGDFDTIAAFWDAAETDRPLGEMMHDLNAELVREAKSGKVYRGHRFESRVVVLVDEQRLSPSRSRMIRDHSPDGFEWGYSGSGPAQLALAILLDLLGDAEVAQHHYQRFKSQFVAGWDRHTWTITETEIRAWLGDGLTVCSE